MSNKNKNAVIGLDMEDMQEWLQEKAFKEETTVENVLADYFVVENLSETEQVVGFKATGDADEDEALFVYFVVLTGMLPYMYVVK